MRIQTKLIAAAGTVCIGHNGDAITQPCRLYLLIMAQIPRSEISKEGCLLRYQDTEKTQEEVQYFWMKFAVLYLILAL